MQERTHRNLLDARVREKLLEDECQRLRVANAALSRNTDNADAQAAAHERQKLLRQLRGPRRPETVFADRSVGDA